MAGFSTAQFESRASRSVAVHGRVTRQTGQLVRAVLLVSAKTNAEARRTRELSQAIREDLHRICSEHQRIALGGSSVG